MDDNRSLSRKRRRHTITDTDAYEEMMLRLTRAFGRRASVDPEALAGMLRVRDELDRWLHAGVEGLRSRGWSDGEIGRHLGVSRQAIRQRWPREGEENCEDIPLRPAEPQARPVCHDYRGHRSE